MDTNEVDPVADWLAQVWFDSDDEDEQEYLMTLIACRTLELVGIRSS